MEEDEELYRQAPYITAGAVTKAALEKLEASSMQLYPDKPQSRNLFQRINAVMRDVRSIKKSKAEGLNFQIVPHDDVTDLLHDALVAHGIVRYPTGMTTTRDGAYLRVEGHVAYVNADNPRDCIHVPAYGESFSEQKNRETREPKPTNVQYGIALSFAIKYADMKLFMLVGDTIPDAELGPAERKPAAPEKPASVFEEVDAIAKSFDQATSREEFEIAQRAASEYGRSHLMDPGHMGLLTGAFGAAVQKFPKQK